MIDNVNADDIDIKRVVRYSVGIAIASFWIFIIGRLLLFPIDVATLWLHSPGFAFGLWQVFLERYPIAKYVGEVLTPTAYTYYSLQEISVSHAVAGLLFGLTRFIFKAIP